MVKYPAIFFDFNIKYDLLKKSQNNNIQKFIFLNDKEILISNLIKTNTKRNIKLKNFWSIELMTLQKAFFKYKFNKARKSFYSIQGSFCNLRKKNIFLFFYNFMKDNLYSVPYLKYFFIIKSLRNLKLEVFSIFDFFKLNSKVFHNITDFYITLKRKKMNTILWLSLYKIVL